MSEARQRILDVAEELFMKHGYEVVKLKDIADALNIKQPSLYYHFEDGKEEIYVEVVKNTLISINEQLNQIVNDHQESIKQTLMALGKWAEKHMIMSPVVMYRVDLPRLSSDHQMELGIKSAKLLFTPLERMLTMAKERKEIRNIREGVVAGILLSMLEGLSQTINWQVDDKMEIWEQSVDILLDGLAVK